MSLPQKTCKICNQRFTPADYLIHLNEEALDQLISLNENMQELREALTLFFGYLEDEKEADDSLTMEEILPEGLTQTLTSETSETTETSEVENKQEPIGDNQSVENNLKDILKILDKI